MSDEFNNLTHTDTENVETMSEADSDIGTSSSEFQPKTDIGAPSMTANEKVHPKKRKLPIIIGIAVALAIVAAIVIFLPRNVDLGNSSSERTTIGAKKSDDGTAYISTMDGNTITINADVLSATLTKDSKTIVVLLNDGTLYYIDKSLATKHIVADNAVSISSVRNDGFFYDDENDHSYRVLFADAVVTDLGKKIVMTVAADTLSVLYSDTNGDIFTMNADSSDQVKVGKYNNSVYMDGISNDGSISVWTLKDSKNNLSIVLNEGDSKTTLGELNNKYNNTSVTFSADQKIIAITNYNLDKMWIKKPGEEVVPVSLGNTLYSNVIYTSSGMLNNQSSSKVQSLFVKVDADNGINIYNINLNGERERVLSKVNDVSFANGYAVYTDVDKNLYYAKIDAKSVGEGIKIASDVDLFDLSKNGKFVYYMRNCEDGEGSLYAFKLGDSEPKKVDSSASCYMSAYYTFSQNRISNDGSAVLYFKEPEHINGTYTEYGTLMMWKFTSGESEKISSDVIVNSLNSGLKTGEINPKGFTFMKYSSVNKDSTIFADYMYFNGSEAVKLANDIIY